MARTRKPSARARRARRPARARSGRGRARGRLGLPLLEQRQLDVLGLGLAALGVFLAFVLYARGHGGTVGEGLADALGWVFGAVRYATPIACVVAGAALVLRPVVPNLRPFRAGAVCLFAAATLALAANVFGIAPAGVRHGFWQPAFFEQRGGIVGEGLYWASAQTVDDTGAQILSVFLFLAGVILVTGASLASMLRAAGEGIVDSTRSLRRSSEALATRLSEATDARRAAPAAFESTPLEPPEPDASELVVRATHVEAPPLDAASRAGALFSATSAPDMEESEALADDGAADEPEPLPPGVTQSGEPQRAGPPERDAAQAQLTPQGNYRQAVTDDPNFEWRLPQASLLRRSSAEQARPDTAGQERIAAQLIEALGHFGVQAKVVGTVTGPHITRYELRLAPGTKVAKVAQLKDDLAYALAATDIRILAPIPGKQAVGVEVPNEHRRIVRLGDVFQQPPADWSPLSVWLGKDVAGRAIGADLAKMPHLLVAGTTGAGKSAAINAMLASVLLRATPHEVRLVLVDPKQVELNHYDGIPHLLTPVITSPRMAANALQNLVREMEQRYGIMSLARMRNLVELNLARDKRGEPRLPYILCVIDELADLMMVAPADVEDSVIRLAQKARAVGIHLVLATQSPRVDVITGMIKANVPSRIAFAVSSQTDSRVILDHNGAESLLGQGDMLFSPVGSSRLQRIQGAYIDEPQVAALTDFWRGQGEPEFREELLEEVSGEGGEDGGGDGEFDPDEDPLLEDAIVLVAEMGTASTSMLQRRLRLGYTRAGRLIDMLERRGIISGYEGSKPRQVLIGEGDVPRVLAALSERGGGGAETPRRARRDGFGDAEDAGDAPAAGHSPAAAGTGTDERG